MGYGVLLHKSIELVFYLLPIDAHPNCVVCVTKIFDFFNIFDFKLKRRMSISKSHIVVPETFPSILKTYVKGK